MVMDQVVQTKIESYILKLKKNLRNLPQSEIDDVVNEIRSHIFDSLELDNSVSKLDAVLRKIGNPKDYANSIIDQYISNSFKKGSFKENFKILLYRMKFPFFITMFIYFMISISVFAFMYQDMKSLFYLFFLLPSIIQFIIPIALLYSVPWAYYALAKTYNENPIKSRKLWKLIFLISLIGSLSNIVIGEGIVPSSNSKSYKVHAELYKPIVQKKKKRKSINISPIKKNTNGMSFLEGKEYISSLPEGYDKNREIFYLYASKIAVYTFTFIIPIFCVVLGIIMTSELFNNTFLVIVSGIFLPFILYFDMSSIPVALDYPIFQAFSSDIILLKITLFMLLGAFLKKEKKLVK